MASERGKGENQGNHHSFTGSLLEEIVLACPGLTWNQVCCELDSVSRVGQGRLTVKAPRL
ncbi:MAG TPA: hypothetical protein VF078_03400 [Nitrospira sp.]